MLISFSVPEMLPYIRDGIRQHNGVDVKGARVKRQTIRQRGPRAEGLLKGASHGMHPGSLHLWWKSRTKNREWLGTIAGFRIYPITILHSTVKPTKDQEYQRIKIDSAKGWREGDPTLFWSPGDPLRGFEMETYFDGFESPEAFRDYFVPNIGDHFDGVIFKW